MSVYALYSSRMLTTFMYLFFLSRTPTLSCTTPISFTSIIEGSHKRKEKYVDGLVSLPRLLMLFPHANTKHQTAEFLGHHISPTLPPIPPLPEPKAPSAHPIWALPPPPPNSGTLFAYMFSYVYHFKSDLILPVWCMILAISYMLSL